MIPTSWTTINNRKSWMYGLVMSHETLSGSIKIQLVRYMGTEG